MATGASMIVIYISMINQRSLDMNIKTKDETWQCLQFTIDSKKKYSHRFGCIQMENKAHKEIKPET